MPGRSGGSCGPCPFTTLGTSCRNTPPGRAPWGSAPSGRPPEGPTPCRSSHSSRRAGHELLVGLLRQGSGVRGRGSGKIQTSSGLTPDPRPLTPAKLTLIAGGLEARGLIQLSLFGDPERGPLLRAAIARIQDRFGETAIVPAGRLVERRREV